MGHLTENGNTLHREKEIITENGILDEIDDNFVYTVVIYYKVKRRKMKFKKT